MAHDLASTDGKINFAYANDVPWHKLGTPVPADLTPVQILEAAGLNWEVEKVPAFANVGGENVNIGQSALVRKTDNRILDVVSNDWNPVQNIEAFEFFNDFIAEGDMTMEVAGALGNGNIVWGAAKIKENFDIFGGDHVDGYLQFTNYHKYGFSTDVRLTAVRSVCRNTLTLSLNSKVDRMVKISHRREFDGDNVKLMLGVAADKLARYKEMAVFLGSKRYDNENVVEFFKRVFPTSGGDKAKKEISRNANIALGLLENQPGAEYAAGSWWSAYNASTYFIDHLAGRTDETRMQSAWYGTGRNVKINALETALEFANA